MQYTTILITYEDNEECPAINASTKALGGKVIALSFNDLFEENIKLQGKIEKLEDNS